MATTKNVNSFDEQDTRLAMGQDTGNFYRKKLSMMPRRYVERTI